MATAEDQTAHSIQREFEDHLACPICIGLYVTPKTLPCQHVYCEQCLVNLAQSNKGCIKCPECRKEYAGKAEDFPTNLKISGLCDYLNRVEDVGQLKDVSTCKKHKHCELSKICCNCTQPVCEMCLLTTHRGHHCVDVAEFLQQRQKQLRDMINDVKGRHQDLKYASDRAVRIRDELCSNYERTTREVHERAQSIKDAVEQSERVLADRLKNDFIRKERNLNSQIQEFNRQLEEMSSALEREEAFQSIQHSPNVIMAVREVWGQYKTIAEREARLAPCEDSALIVEWNQRTLEQVCLQMTLGKVIGRPTAIPYESYIDAPVFVKVGQEVEIRLRLRDHMGSEVQNDAADVSAFVYAPPGDKIVQVELKCKPQEGLFKAWFTPKYIGKYQIVVKLAGDMVKNSPFNLLVKTNLSLKMLLKGKLNMNNPHDIAEVEDGFLIADKGNMSVIKVNEKFQILSQLPKPLLKRGQSFDPFAVIATKDFIYVSDLANSRVVMYDLDCTLLMEVGKDHLKKPTGIAVNDLLYVADDELWCILVFSTEGEFIKSISQPGCGPDDLKHPWHLVFNKRGHLLVCDAHNNRIQVFQPNEGVLIKSIPINRNNKILQPRGIALDQNDNIFISAVEPGRPLMGLHCVMAFTQDGDFLGMAEGARFNYPRGLIVTRGDQQTVLVVDGAHHCIKEIA